MIVSSRAKNAGDSAFTSTCAGSASVSHISARAVAAVSSAGEGAVLEQQPHDRLAQHDQAERCRQRQADREFEAARFRMRDRRRGSSPRTARVIPGSAPCPWRRRRYRAAVRPGGWRNRATIPPRAMSDATIAAPATIKQLRRAAGDHAGGPPWPRKPRISASNEIRSGVAMPAATAQHAGSRAATVRRCRRWRRGSARHATASCRNTEQRRP